MKNEFVMVPRELLKRAADRLSDMGRAPISEPMFKLMNEQHQGEPAALPARKTVTTGLLSESNTHNQGWNACLDEIARLGPIYTRADHGEVERLRADVETMRRKNNEYWHETETLRAQLAERDALISELEEDRLRMQEGLKDVIDWIGCSQSTGALRTIAEKALSASSEPSVPTWSCQPCKIEQPTDRPCDACSGATELKIWQS